MYQSVNELINSYDDDDDLPMQLRLLASRMYLVLQTAHSARLLVVLHVQPLLQFAHTGIQQKHKTSQQVFKKSWLSNKRVCIISNASSCSGRRAFTWGLHE